MKFEVISDYKPKGDQPQAIEKLAQGIEAGERYQTLLGVTGSGKTFTVANVIQEVQKPTLILAHNKTLAAQLIQDDKGQPLAIKVEGITWIESTQDGEVFLLVTDSDGGDSEILTVLIKN